MINHQQLERQRLRLYKNSLKKDFQRKNQMKRMQSMQIKSKDYQNIQEKIYIGNLQTQQQRQKDFLIQNHIKEQNFMLSNIKNRNKQFDQTRLMMIPLKGSSLLQELQQNQAQRLKQGKQIAKKLYQQNYQEQHVHKIINNNSKNFDLVEDQKHLERLSQVQAMRRQQDQGIRKKHSVQHVIAFEKHKQLQQINEQNRQSLQSFAVNGKDILDSLKRDDRAYYYLKKRKIDQQLKSQVLQKQRSFSTKPQQQVDLSNSIFSKILFKNQNKDQKGYANYLQKQINQTDLRKSQEKSSIKEKSKIQSIYGGEVGTQRLKMMKYIDQNLGIQGDVMKKIQPRNKAHSTFRMNNLYEFNGQKLKGTINNNAHNTTYESNNNQNPQKPTLISTETMKQLNPQQKTQNMQLKLPENNHKRSYLSYDFINGSPKRYAY